MPWKECSKMDERMKFIVRKLDGEKMSELCDEFGISRVTGYKIWNRYQDVGLKGLYDRKRAPKRSPTRLPIQIETLILKIKKEKTDWGAPKIQDRIARKYSDIKIPAKSTIHAVLDRHGLVKRRRKRRYKAKGTYLSVPKAPNDLWCADFKGEFKLGNKMYCYPLTITDFTSRYILACEALETTKTSFSFEVFERVFKEYGLPAGMRTDNGTPFASANALFGLSYLSVWWLRLGIKLERIKPGNPQQNGRHERMHRTLKLATTKPPAQNLFQQQEKFDHFVDEFNADRPHEALQMKYPSEVYTPCSRKYAGLPNLEYPFHDRTITVTSCGRVCIKKQKINLSKVFAHQDVGVSEVSDGIWLVSFMDYDLGYFDEDSNNFEPLEDPFNMGLKEKV